MQSAIATIICWGSYPLGEFLFTGWVFIHWVGFYQALEANGPFCPLTLETSRPPSPSQRQP